MLLIEGFIVLNLGDLLVKGVINLKVCSLKVHAVSQAIKHSHTSRNETCNTDICFYGTDDPKTAKNNLYFKFDKIYSFIYLSLSIYL